MKQESSGRSSFKKEDQELKRRRKLKNLLKVQLGGGRGWRGVFKDSCIRLW
jgi:hypothetical protein